MSNGTVSIPAEYDVCNLIANQVSPNTLHCNNTALFGYYRRYLLQEVFSIYKWELPEDWDEDYFKYCLFCSGYVGIIKTEEFGIIPQYCTLGGYNVFYRPAWIMVSNPLLPETLQLNIDKDCSIIKLTPDYLGIMDLVNHYADKMALASETIDIDLCNAMVSTVFGAETQTEAAALKKMYDKIRSGNPAVVIGKKFFNEDGSPRWTPFQNNVKNTYIVTDLIADLRRIKQEFLTDIGCPNANTDKRERLINSEVNANNVETKSKVELWLESIQKGIAKTKKLFGDLPLSVEYRFKQEYAAEELIVERSEN